jgi:RNA recognition motif-containing protein
MEEECKNKRSIFVAALKESITEDDLVMYFSAFGKVVRAVKSTDRCPFD